VIWSMICFGVMRWLTRSMAGDESTEV